MIPQIAIRDQAENARRLISEAESSLKSAGDWYSQGDLERAKVCMTSACEKLTLAKNSLELAVTRIKELS